MSIRLTEQQVKDHQAKVHAKIHTRNPNSNADMESNSGNASLGAEKVQGFSSPVRVLVTHHRKRLVDTGGASEKWAMDAIVRAGILEDDTAKHIEEIKHKQVKIKKGDTEKTVFEIEAA